MTVFDEPLEKLRARIDDLETMPPEQATRAWSTLAAQVDVLCKHLEKSEPEVAHATLPVLGDVIRQLDRVIEELRRALPSDQS